MKKIIDDLWWYLEEILAFISLVSAVVAGFLINNIVGVGILSLATAIGSLLTIKYKDKLYK